MDICVVPEYTSRNMGLTVQDRDKTGDTETCEALKDGLQVSERTVGAFARV